MANSAPRPFRTQWKMRFLLLLFLFLGFGSAFVIWSLPPLSNFTYSPSHQQFLKDVENGLSTEISIVANVNAEEFFDAKSNAEKSEAFSNVTVLDRPGPGFAGADFSYLASLISFVPVLCIPLSCGLYSSTEKILSDPIFTSTEGFIDYSFTSSEEKTTTPNSSGGQSYPTTLFPTLLNSTDFIPAFEFKSAPNGSDQLVNAVIVLFSTIPGAFFFCFLSLG